VLDLLIEASPDSADEHKQRAVALLQQQRVPEALAEFKRYLDLARKLRIGSKSRSRSAISGSG